MIEKTCQNSFNLGNVELLESELLDELLGSSITASIFFNFLPNINDRWCEPPPRGLLDLVADRTINSIISAAVPKKNRLLNLLMSPLGNIQRPTISISIKNCSITVIHVLSFIPVARTAGIIVALLVSVFLLSKAAVMVALLGFRLSSKRLWTLLSSSNHIAGTMLARFDVKIPIHSYHFQLIHPDKLKWWRQIWAAGIIIFPK
uniref:Uncharacterized protein n=1 Tax=Glossina pallidipes TaxID=7398 RepID=A0A1A9ZA19_GLOPL